MYEMPVVERDGAEKVLALLMQPRSGAELLDDLLSRPEWHARAACRGMGTDLFFPVDSVTLARATKICSGCGVREECGRFAIEHPSLKGIWAGTSERRRARTRQEALRQTVGRRAKNDGRHPRSPDH
jgi:WhiB family transcriptional regulator, redox-sensing transcriptional regulator